MWKPLQRMFKVSSELWRRRVNAVYCQLLNLQLGFSRRQSLRNVKVIRASFAGLSIMQKINWIGSVSKSVLVA